MSNALVLVAPGLLALPAPALAAARALATFGQYAEAPHAEPRGIAAALFGALDASPETPVAPLALLGAGGDPGDDYVLCADWVHLALDRDTVVLARTIDDLSPDESAALVAMLDRHFATDGLRFEALRPNACFVRCDRRADLVTTPPDAARGRRLIASLPRGSDARIWKRWQNEIEMLLHEHPVNAAREARNLPPVTGVWFSGGGCSMDVGALPPTCVSAPDTRLGDLAHGIARRSAAASTCAHDALAEALARAARTLEDADGSGFVVGVATLPADECAAFEAQWLAPALDALAARRIDTLHLIADGDGTAVTWTARPPTRWQRLAARASRRAFAVPATPDP
jgi:hypothetical protein